MDVGPGQRLLAICPGATVPGEKFVIRCQDVGADGAEVTSTQTPTIARIEISGPLAGELTTLESIFGEKTSYQQIQDAISRADASRADTTLAVIRSPGGEVVGMGQTAAAFRNASNRVAVFAPKAFSAAYGIASGADVIAMPRDGLMGSLSAFVSSEDTSELFKRLGIKTRIFSPDAAKGAGFPGVPLSDEATADMDALAVKLKAGFAEILAEGRTNITPGALAKLMKAQDFTATEALEAGLVDSIFDTEAQFVASLFTPTTEDAEMDDTNKGAGKSSASTEEAGINKGQAAAPPAAPPDQRIEAMLEGIAGLKGTVETLASTVEALASTVAQNADEKLRARLEAAKATDIDHELAVCKALTPELREAHVAKLEKDGRGRAAFDDLGELMNARLDVPTPGGESVSVPADGGLDLAPGSFDLTDAACNTQAIAFADKVNPNKKSTEWKAAHRTEYERLSELAAGDSP